MTTLNKKHHLPLNASIVLLSAFWIMCGISCKKDESAATSQNETDTGIHEKIERGPATVTLDVDRKEITIAERLNLLISITVDEDYDVKLPGFGEKLEQFGIVDYHTARPELIGDGRMKLGRSYVLEPFLSGEYTVPPMVIRFWKKGEQEAGEHKVETPEVTIKVKSLLPEDMKEMKLNEIRPPVKFPRSYIIWIWTGIAAALIVIVVVTAILISKKRKKSKGEGSAPRVPAHELAYEELKKLVAEDLPNKGKTKLFYQRISGILRRYIENRFGLHAPEQTTEEFLEGLKSERDFEEQYKTLLKTFLSHCDLVKFAEYQPATEDIQKTFDSCRAFIEGTEEGE